MSKKIKDFNNKIPSKFSNEDSNINFIKSFLSKLINKQLQRSPPWTSFLYISTSFSGDFFEEQTYEIRRISLKKEDQFKDIIRSWFVNSV